ncbi:MAG: RagB/SusD family nutrient uptake outer membrane protein [Bacteroidota bacterium]|nr:RagB/SusD family nutrient uptake outer membrane protein [Bacteroidota bacterium]MDP4212617.1 RagB/SusD family nutrient uptake outer membrane protein [Bacteroidota bacterium]MDP4248677.1 RagB/SusD family nutrient uptake outer membrane protein [Bacteroidota bacterium]
MKWICIILIIIFAVGSCKKWISVAPPITQLSNSTLFEDSVTANAAVSGIYGDMMTSFLGICGGNLTLLTGLQADEFQTYAAGSDQSAFYNNAINPASTNLQSLWKTAYKYIYESNAVLEGLSHSLKISSGARSQFEGEVKFLRAFCHFYLLQYFGNIPYVSTTDYRTNQEAVQISRKEIFQKIMQDLGDAIPLLSIDYHFSGGERARVNRSSALALMARVKLYDHDWVDAEQFASQVIGSGLYQLETDLSKVFLKNSSEAIWQLAPVNPSYNTWEGYEFILHGQPTSAPAQVALSNSLINSWEPGDARRAIWIDSIVVGPNTYFFPFKYEIQNGGNLQEYYMVLRLAEQYLIRAEARAMQNNFTGSVEDINAIRSRASLPLLSSISTQDSCLAMIGIERRHELFCEWGHRWFDLVRRHLANAVLSPIKPGWQDTDTLAPIPITEIQNDPNLIQNKGY